MIESHPSPDLLPSDPDLLPSPDLLLAAKDLFADSPCTSTDNYISSTTLCDIIKAGNLFNSCYLIGNRARTGMTTL